MKLAYKYALAALVALSAVLAIVFLRPPARIDQSAQRPSEEARLELRISEATRSAIDSRLPAFDPNAEIEVPFTSFSTRTHRAQLLISPNNVASVLEIDGHRVSFARQGVPLKLIETQPNEFAVFFRETFSNRLYLYRFASGKTTARHLKGKNGAEFIFRQAAMHNGRLYAVLYDNAKLKNQLYEIQGEQQTLIGALPTVDDPGGATYEMIPSVFMLSDPQHLWIASGTLLQGLRNNALDEPKRLEGCLRAQEVVLSPGGLTVLCVSNEADSSNFKVFRLHQDMLTSAPVSTGALPWLLKPDGQFSTATTSRDIIRVLQFDLLNNHASGVMELGTNNDEGRVPWSQIYFLNGLLDVLALARADERAATLFSPIIADVKRRLDLEMFILNKLYVEHGFLTKGFTVGRKPVLYAVQTSRLLLLFDRYSREITHGAILSGRAALAESVLSLANHIDVVTRESPQMRANNPYLYWPKNSPAYFDGLNVPYNHQNEWAYAIASHLEGKAEPSAQEQQALSTSRKMVETFLEEVAANGVMPSSGEWPYWWGRARNPWTEKDSVSVHTPAYKGDTLVSFISFRTIDVMSTLKAVDQSKYPHLAESVEKLTVEGKVYPFASASFGWTHAPRLRPRVALYYARLTAPWDLQSSVWAFFNLHTAALHN